MKKLTGEQKRHLLLMHYAKLVPGVAIILTLILVAAFLFATLHNKQEKELQSRLESEQLYQRLNNLEIKVQDLQYEKTQPVELGLSPVQFRKIVGSANWQMFDNDYSIGQINSTIAITPRIIKSQGNLVYIGVYSEINSNNSPITIFELIRPINILKVIWDVKGEQIYQQTVYDLDVCNRYLLYSQNNNLVVYDFYAKKTINSFDLSQYLGSFMITNALFNAQANQIAFSTTKTKETSSILENSQLHLIDIATQKISTIPDYPENLDCHLSSFNLVPAWKCNN